ncbi:hypothetical protein H1C71_041808 [Ictidomys tridecemlineatus]|nr:hypothetical protein H1C71_041808 [Ictidomys tridecemlineatus]KAG3284084.1 hypothetical protein H1C71_041808 [Ictidomys tridecemlineatus]
MAPGQPQHGDPITSGETWVLQLIRVGKATTGSFRRQTVLNIDLHRGKGCRWELFCSKEFGDPELSPRSRSDSENVCAVWTPQRDKTALASHTQRPVENRGVTHVGRGQGHRLVHEARLPPRADPDKQKSPRFESRLHLPG